MRNTTVAKSSVKSNWLALLLGVAFAAVTVQSCSIDKSKYTFVPDDQFPNSMSGAANGGAANGGGAHAGGAHAGGKNGGAANAGENNAGDGGMSGPGGAAAAD